MSDVVFSLPDDVISALKHAVPVERHNLFVTEALRRALAQEEQELAECARAVEQDEVLNGEMKDWDITLTDGIWRPHRMVSDGV